MKKKTDEIFLAVDIGNSCISMGLFRGLSLLKRNDVPSAAGEEIFRNALKSFTKHFSPSSSSVAVVSSVNRSAERALVPMMRRKGFKVVYVKSLVDRKIFRRYTTFEKLGSDRVANAYYCIYLVKAPAVVVDCGTTLHADIIDGKCFMGGYIISSHLLEWEAIRSKARGTAVKLSSAWEEARIRPGLSTAECLQNGISLSKESFVSSCVAESKKCLRKKNIKIIVTGGNLKKLKNRDIFDIVDKNVTLKGMAAAYILFRGGIC
jgi:pantothenate kinase type III